MKVPPAELMSDILMRVRGEAVLPVHSSIAKFKRKDGVYVVAEDYSEIVKKREIVNAKERLRVRVTSVTLQRPRNWYCVWWLAFCCHASFSFYLYG